MSAVSGGSTSSLAFALTGGASAATLPQVPSAALGKGAKAAREFEAQLIGNLLESMEKSFASLPGQEAMAGEDDYNYLGTHALASAIAEGGGFGIAQLICEHLERTEVSPKGRKQS